LPEPSFERHVTVRAARFWRWARCALAAGTHNAQRGVLLYAPKAHVRLPPPGFPLLATSRHVRRVGALDYVMFVALRL
jgi:hypothetical protein